MSGEKTESNQEEASEPEKNKARILELSLEVLRLKRNLTIMFVVFIGIILMVIMLAFS